MLKGMEGLILRPERFIISGEGTSFFYKSNGYVSEEDFRELAEMNGVDISEVPITPNGHNDSGFLLYPNKDEICAIECNYRQRTRSFEGIKTIGLPGIQLDEFIMKEQIVEALTDRLRIPEAYEWFLEYRALNIPQVGALSQTARKLSDD